MKKESILFILLVCLTGIAGNSSNKFNIKEYEFAMSAPYFKLWNADEQARIDRDIEKNRKADGVFALNVPSGTEVTVEQTRHAFYFGAFFAIHNRFETKEENDAVDQLWIDLFNSATIPFYWKLSFERVEGVFTTKKIDDMIAFCDTHKIRKHGHPIIWGSNVVVPEWVLGKLPEEARKTEFFKTEYHEYQDAAKKRPNPTAYWCAMGTLTEAEFAEKYPDYVRYVNEIYAKRIVDVCTMYGDKIDSWDVVNESVADSKPQPYYGDAPRLVPGGKISKSIYGALPGDYVWRSFKMTEACLPESAWLNINDVIYGHPVDDYAEQVKNLLERGAKINVIGCQMHIFKRPVTEKMAAGETYEQSPEMVRKALDKLSELPCKLHLSEITLMAPTEDARGEAIQAVLTYNLYRLWFSYPAMSGITWWNTVDHVSKAEDFASGVLRRDMSKKPVYYALDDLINHQWKTNLTVKADQNGKIAFRGFRGTYRLTWKDASGKMQIKTVELQ